jgi:hypothetical protein
MTPSEVRGALRGDLRLTVLQTPLSAAPPGWATLAGASLPAALALGGVGLIVRRRMALRGLDSDLVLALGRIEARARIARQALGRSHDRSAPQIGARFEGLRRGARTIARQAQNARGAQNLLDRRALAREIGVLERRLAAETGDTDAAPGRREAQATLAEKQKALARLDDLKRAEELAGLRLAKIEAVLDGAALTLRSAQASAAQAAAPADDERLRRELDAELEALHEVERDLAARRETQTELLYLAAGTRGRGDAARRG